jgi:DNA repair protein RecO (recombination protein O)
MAHHIYTTDAIVIESTPAGEADRFFTLFTRELGLIRASAKGVRLQKSKLKYSLQDFSRSTISLVRGKEIWRITSARIEDNIYHRYAHDAAVLRMIAKVLSLIKRLVAGEQKDERLFAILLNAFNFLETHGAWKEELVPFEIILVLRILDDLGYAPRRQEFKHFLVGEWSSALLLEMEQYKALAFKEINTSLRETQL